MCALLAQVQPPVRLLMGPGPSPIHPSVLQALAAPTVGHLDPYYLHLMDQLQAGLRELFCTRNRFTMAMSGTGSAGMEACLANLVEPGDRVLICVNGVFGKRMVDVATRCGAEVIQIEKPWGSTFTPDDLAAGLAQRPKLVGVVMAETSTGAYQDIPALANVIKAAGALLLVDAVTALGGVPVEVDAWGIDAIYSGTQKCLGCPPGLSPVSFSDRALEVVANRKIKVQSWYLDTTMLSQYWGSDRVYHHTAPINMTYALHEATRLVLAEGLAACHARHALNHRALQAGLSALGMELVPAAGERLPMLNAVRIPAGVEDGPIRQGLLQRFNIEIGAGLGPFKGQVWRIGLMGHGSRAENVYTFLSALEYLLGEQKYAFSPGSSVAAANAVYGAASPAA